MVTENKRLKSAYDTAANWTSGNPILLPGEIGIESDTKNVKVGDGSTSWNSLNYSSIGVTAYDSSLGRLAIGGVEMGSTGIRDVTALINAKYTTITEAKLKRQGGTVSLLLDITTGGSAIVSGDITLTLPSGFRPTTNRRPIYFINFATPSVAYISSSGGQGGIVAGAAARIFMDFTFDCAASWPASLPGTQVTAPFT